MAFVSIYYPATGGQSLIPDDTATVAYWVGKGWTVGTTPAVTSPDMHVISQAYFNNHAVTTDVQTLTAAQQAQAITNTGIFYLSNGTDQTAAINAWLADSNTLSVKKVVGSFSVSNVLTVPDGVTLDLTRATITQTGSNKITLALGNNTTLLGGTIVGKGTDYVAGASPTAMGVDVNGKTNVQIRGTRVSNMAGAGVRVYGSTSVQIANAVIVGVGSPTITSGDGDPCYGVLIDNTSTSVSISSTDISEACQGIIGGLTSSRVTLSNVTIHDIRGQHGVYLQNGTGVNVTNLSIRNTQLDGMKIQLSGSSAADSQGTSIAGLSVDTCTDVALEIVNVAADLTSAKRFRAVTIANLTSTNCGRGLYLGSVRAGSVSNVAVYNCSLDAITLIDCQNIEGGRWVADTCGRIGLRLTGQTGSVQDQIAIDGLRIHNAGNNNVASNIYGVLHFQGSNVSMSQVKVTATNGFMQYGYYMQSTTAGDQQTFALRNSQFSGDTGTSARFQTTQTTVKDWTNNRLSGSILTGPTGVDTATDVGSPPTAAAGANAGTSPPAPVVAATSRRGRGSVTFGTGTTPAAGAQLVVTFAVAIGSTPVVTLAARNSATAALGLYISAASSTAFTVSTTSAPAASQANTVYSIDYIVSV